MGAGGRPTPVEGEQAALRAAAPFLGDIDSVEELSGGAVSAVFRVGDVGGCAVVVKTADDPPPDLFAVEAEGLRVLARVGGLLVPQVRAVGSSYLVLEAMTSEPMDDDGFWERAGVAVALLHRHQGDRFGWEQDGWLGRLRQFNPWSEDGHDFFAEHRLLRYLDEPRAEAALSRETRQGIERICARLPQLVPTMPAVLTHGDLWRNNVVMTGAGGPAFIDPAVCWMWAEADLSMALCAGGTPERFFHAYNEIQPLEDGWRERAELLNLRELLSIVAHFGAVWDIPARIADTVGRFAG